MKSWKDNVSFVLVEPKEPGNIGATARAMKNMGFKNLELVSPRTGITDEARRMACHATDILESAGAFPTVREAIAGKGLIIGTTRRIGKRRGLHLPLRDCVKRVITAAHKNRVAILFGREEKGLSNQEVEECGFLMTIPTDPESPSLNLAQSVLLIAYELSSQNDEKAGPRLVEHGELSTLFGHIQDALRLLEYNPRGSRDLEERIMRNLKHLIGRAGLTDWERRMLMGIISQVKRKLSREDS